MVEVFCQGLSQNMRSDSLRAPSKLYTKTNPGTLCEEFHVMLMHGRKDSAVPYVKLFYHVKTHLILRVKLVLRVSLMTEIREISIL